MPNPNKLSLMKRAALRAVVQHAVKSGTLGVSKQASTQRMVSFLKQGGVTAPEVYALCQSVKLAQMLPAAKAFEKVAQVTGISPETLKAIYLSKKAIDLGTLAGGGLGAAAGLKYGPLGALAGGVLGGAAGGAVSKLPDAISHSMNPYQMSPERRALYQRIQNEAVGNRRLSQDLQAINGSFAPAGNPWTAGAGGLNAGAH